MTDYDTMPAGPEMDRAVAEKVMGWHWDDAEDAWCLGERIMFGIRANRWGLLDHWSPSSNTTHAFAVVDHCRAKDWQVTMQWDKVDRVWRTWVNGGLPIENTDKAALAISRAALKAVGAG